MNDNYFAENSNLEEQVVKWKKYVSIPTLIISLITTVVLVIIVASNWGNVVEMFGGEASNSEDSIFEELVVWDEVMLSGEIFDDLDIVNYTHILDSKNYGELWLKSQNINLNNYEDEVYLEGIVEKIQQWIPVIEVDTIYALDMEEEILTWDIDEEIEEVETKYLSNVWIYFDEDFFEKYSLVNAWEAGVLKIKDVETKEIISLDYFKCNTAVENQNCDRFNEMFATSSVQKFVDSAGIAYYKQSEIQSWFFSNGSLFGYFANDVEDSKFKELVKYLTIVDEDFVEDNVLNNLDAVCRNDGKWLENMWNYELIMKNGELYLDIEGNDWSESVLSCEVKLDLTLKNKARLINLEVVWEIEEEVQEDIDDDGEDSVEIVENYDRDSDVEQFPINLEKALEFTSRRGHTIVFPSSNIAYAGKSVQEDFDTAWVNCFSVMNVVQYSEKELVDQKWSVKIYECTVKDGFDDSSDKLIYKELADQKFVIEIVDPAWVQFGNNVNIK